MPRSYHRNSVFRHFVAEGGLDLRDFDDAVTFTMMMLLGSELSRISFSCRWVSTTPRTSSADGHCVWKAL